MSNISASNISSIHPLDVRFKALLHGDGGTVPARTLRGVFNGLPSPAIVEMCAFAGFDFVVIDNEHGSAGIETTENMLRAGRAAGIPVAVRCLEQNIARTLDAGAGALQIPMVQSAAHAVSIVQRIRYPLPRTAMAESGAISGERGSAFSGRAAGYGAFGGVAHTARSNSGIALIVMVETLEAVNSAAEIAAVPGVDGVFIGPNDLAHTMGFENRWSEARVQAAIEKTIRAVAAAGKCAGILALSQDEENRYAAWGARYFASTTTGIITRAFREAATGGRVQQGY